ncbi:MAG: hypothetical protein FJX78_01970 [Armatimonadetes bacterium]|nr:hypothetical protein [Armatimonadota bacterium]
MTRMACVLALAHACLLVVGPPAVAAQNNNAGGGDGDRLVRSAFVMLLGNPPALHMEVVHDLYENVYARISLYAQKAKISGMAVDELWVKLVGVTFDGAALRRGQIKATETRQSYLHGSVAISSIETYLASNKDVKEIKLEFDRGDIAGDALINIGGVYLRTRMRTFFEAAGTPEVYIRVRNLWVNGLPVPQPLVEMLERRINPLLDIRQWPMRFQMAGTRITPTSVILSTQKDLAAPCGFCVTPENP